MKQNIIKRNNKYYIEEHIPDIIYRETYPEHCGTCVFLDIDHDTCLGTENNGPYPCNKQTQYKELKEGL